MNLTFTNGLNILLVIIILFSLFMQSKNGQESFTINDLSVMFPSPKRVYDTIVDSGYFDNFSAINYTVRGIRSKEAYINEIKEVNSKEQKSMTKLYNYILSQADEINIKNIIVAADIKFAKFTHKLEGNMPHTHKNIIMIPEYMYDYISKYPTLDSYKKHGGTILHEICHVLQRCHPSEFKNLYATWNFHKYDLRKIDNFKEIIERIRANPDGMDNDWIWKYEKVYVLLAVFRENAISLNDVDYNYFIIDNSTVLRVGAILDDKNFNRFFKIENNIYHPNEISAEYFSMYFMGRHVNSEGYRIFSDWITKLKSKKT